MTVAGSISARRILPYWGLFLALGILEAVVGVWLLYRPGLTLLAMVFAIGLWAILYGIVLTAVSIELKNLPDRLDELERQVTTSMAEPRPVTARAG